MADTTKPAATDDFDAFPLVSEQETEAKDDFAEFPLAEPTMGEKARAVGQGATGGLMESAPIIPGMIMGAKIGALGGPAAPFTVPLGAAAGAGAGYLFGKGARLLASEIPFAGDTLTKPDIESFDPALRPYAVGGEVVGAGLPFSAAPLVTTARLPASKVGTFINRIIDFAQASPRTFVASEAFGLAGASVGGGMSESYYPGEEGKRMAFEVAGGFLNPSRLLVGTAKTARDSVKMVLQSMSRSGRETRAAQILQEIVTEAGEDPKLLAAMLKESGIPGTSMTSAQKTGSPALIALETKLKESSAKFGAEAEKEAEESLKTISNMVSALRGTGDPAALQAAADLRVRYFRTLLAARLQTAEREAVEYAKGITADTPGMRAQLSVKARESVEGAMKDARQAETQLWERIPRDLKSPPTNLLKTYDNLRADMLPEEPMPAIVEGFISRMREAGETTTGEMIRFRSRALALAREADAQGKANDARIYGRLAEATLDDLDGVFSGPSAGVMRTLGKDVDAYNEARAFSRELHDTFTRAFGGQTMQTTARGADRIPPELTLRRALGTGSEGGALRFRELEEATRFASGKGLVGPENFDTMIDAQERMLRLAAADAIDPNTGRVSATRLAKTIRDNEELLNRFPDVKTDLEAALKSENSLKNVERQITKISRVIDQQSAFVKLTKYENAADAVSAAVLGKTPIHDLTAMAKVAKRGGGDQAVAGYRAAIWDYAIRQASDAAGNIDLEKLNTVLMKPIRPGQPSILQFMQRSGLSTTQDAASIGKLMAAAEKVAASMKGVRGLEEVVPEVDSAFDMMVRIAGSRSIAATGVANTTGSSLIAAQAGAKYFQKIFAKVPQGKVRDVLIEAAQNPKFAALLLEKPATEKRGIALARQIHAYMLQAGITGDDETTTTGQGQ